MSSVWIFLHLLFLSVEDLWEGELLFPVILELGITGAVRAVCLQQGIVIWPGILLLIFSYLSQEKIGYGDGWLLLALGMWLPREKLFRIFFTGICLSTVGAVCLRKREVPLVPFLMIAYLLEGFI